MLNGYDERLLRLLNARPGLAAFSTFEILSHIMKSAAKDNCSTELLIYFLQLDYDNECWWFASRNGLISKASLFLKILEYFKNDGNVSFSKLRIEHQEIILKFILKILIQYELFTTDHVIARETRQQILSFIEIKRSPLQTIGGQSESVKTNDDKSEIMTDHPVDFTKFHKPNILQSNEFSIELQDMGAKKQNASTSENDNEIKDTIDSKGQEIELKEQDFIAVVDERLKIFTEQLIIALSTGITSKGGEPRLLNQNEKLAIFIEVYSVLPFSIEHTYHLLSWLQDACFPTHLYFVELLSYHQVLKDADLVKRSQLTKSFFASHKPQAKDSVWSAELLDYLYSKYGHGRSDSEAFYSLANELVAASRNKRHENEKPNVMQEGLMLLPLGHMINRVVDDAVAHRDDQYILNSLLSRALGYIHNNNVNPFVHYCVGKQSFFDLLLKAWETCAKSSLSQIQKSQPVMLNLREIEYTHYYEICVDAKNENDFIRNVAIYHLLATSLHDSSSVDSQKKLFSLLLRDEIASIHNMLKAVFGMPHPESNAYTDLCEPLDDSLSVLKKRIQEKDVLQFIEKAFNQKVVVYQKHFDEQKGLVELVANNNDDSIASQDENVIRLLEMKPLGANSTPSYRILLNSAVVHRNLDLSDYQNNKDQYVHEMRYAKTLHAIANTMQHIFNLSHYVNRRFVPHMTQLPISMRSLPVHLSRSLFDLLLERPDVVARNSIFNTSNEMKNDGESADIQTVKVSAIYCTLGSYVEKRYVVNGIDTAAALRASVDAIPELHGSNDNVDYAILFHNNIAPRFYGKFEDSNVKAFILKHVNNPNLHVLYQAHQKMWAEDSLINVVNLPVHKDKLLTDQLLAILAQIQALLSNAPCLQSDTNIQVILNMQNVIYKVIRKIIYLYDDESSNLKSYHAALSYLYDVVLHLQPFDELTDQKIQLLKSKINQKALNEADLKQLSEAISEEYPLPQEILDAFDGCLQLGDPDELARFIAYCVEKNKLRWMLYSNMFYVAFDNFYKQVNLYNEDYRKKIIDVLATSLTTSQVATESKEQDQPLAITDSLFVHSRFNLRREYFAVALTYFKLLQLNRQPELIALCDSFIYEIERSKYTILNDENCQQILAILMSSDLPEAQAIHEKITDFFIRLCQSSDLANSSFIKKIDPDMLRKIAFIVLSINQFPLLQIMNQVCKEQSNQAIDIWNDADGQMRVDFREKFVEVLGLTGERSRLLASLMQLPNFFSPLNVVVGELVSNTTINDKQFIQLVKMVLTSNADVTLEQVVDYVLRIRDMNSVQQQWNSFNEPELIGIETKLYDAIEANAQEFSLEDINIMLTIFGGLGPIPDGFKLKQQLDSILTQPPAEWVARMRMIPQLMLTFTIAGMPVEEVQQMFKTECKPSIDELLGERALFINLKQEKNLSPVDYFFEVYRGAKQFINNYRFGVESKLSQDVIIPRLLQILENSTPGLLNKEEDIAYFGALALLSFYKLAKEPFHAQLVTVIASVYGLEYYDDMLGKVGTAQGKTIILALIAISCLKIHDPSYVMIFTLTKDLANRDYEENRPLFAALNIKVNALIGKRSENAEEKQDARIRYMTAKDFITMRADKYMKRLTIEYKLPSNNKKKPILLMDEVDVILDDRNNKVEYYVVNHIAGSRAILSSIYNAAKSGTCYSFASCEESDAYLDLNQNERKFIANIYDKLTANASRVVNESKTKKPNVTSKGESIFENSTGIIEDNLSYGNGYTNFREYEAGLAMHDIGTVGVAISYKNAVAMFSKRLGMSGTLETAYDSRYQMFEASNSNLKNLKILEPIICSDEIWDDRLKSQMHKYSNQGLPILVVLEKPSEVEEFKTAENVNKLVGAESIAVHKKIVAAATKRSSEGLGQITKGSIISARGIDYQVIDKHINDDGGMVILNGYIQNTDRLELQVMARTARVNRPGIYQPVYKLSEFIKFLTDAKIPKDQIDRAVADVKCAEEKKNGNDSVSVIPSSTPSQLIALARKNYAASEKKSSNDTADDDLFSDLTADFFNNIATKPGLSVSKKQAIHNKLRLGLFNNLKNTSSEQLSKSKARNEFIEGYDKDTHSENSFLPFTTKVTDTFTERTNKKKS